MQSKFFQTLHLSAALSLCLMSTLQSATPQKPGALPESVTFNKNQIEQILHLIGQKPADVKTFNEILHEAEKTDRSDAFRKQMDEFNREIDNNSSWLKYHLDEQSSLEREKKSFCDENHTTLWQFLLDCTDAPSDEQTPVIKKILALLHLPETTQVRCGTGKSYRRAYTPNNEQGRQWLDDAILSQNNMIPCLERLFRAANVWCLGGHTIENITRQLSSLCSVSPTAHQLVCCFMAKLLGARNLLDLANDAGSQTSVTFDIANIPHVDGNAIYLPLGESHYAIPHVNLLTGEVADKIPEAEAILSHELDHWSSLLESFLALKLPGYKDLTFTHIFPYLQTVTANPDDFKKMMATDPLFFNAVAKFFKCQKEIDEPSEDFQDRVLETALAHFEDLTSQARAGWTSSEEIRNIVGINLIQTPQKERVLFLHMLSNTFQALETGRGLPWLHRPYNKNTLGSFTTVSVNEDVIWALADLRGITRSEYFGKKRGLHTLSLRFVLQSGPLNALWRWAYQVTNELAKSQASLD